MRLEEDLKRAGIAVKWWVINSSFYRSETTNQLLAAKASHEVTWINKVAGHSDGNFAVIPWTADEVKGEKLKELF
jgi:arsenite-transporting ATPase